ncbi:uncharacterized protein LOC119980772 [Tripterygium wilfordii]|uniref:uncharacterized protein LOC119980772 n=1 Tax=Tripterygium wilfordii TaxID=458696 RepID=UPI0018F7F934|nr:uncharacterized protein LOC119980772 [Tripterygium wilfordii]
MNSLFKRIQKFYDDSSSNLSFEDEFEDLLFLEYERKRFERGSTSRIGSHRQHSVINRNRLQDHELIFNDYFAESLVYNDAMFRRRFRMNRALFLRIQSAIEMHEPYFRQRRDAAGRLGLSSLQKITAALRILASGVAANFMDEYVIISESTAIESVKYFTKAVISIFGPEYLRSPKNNDIELLLALNKTRGFPGMLGSIDWSHNDINVLERSHVFSELTQGSAPIVNYSINGHNYTMGHYLADGIYPSWATFVKSIQLPQTMKAKHFARCQESVRKDVERAFGVLQSRFAVRIYNAPPPLADHCSITVNNVAISSLIGAFVIIVGIYCVLWGKKKDAIVNRQPENWTKPSLPCYNHQRMEKPSLPCS